MTTAGVGAAARLHDISIQCDGQYDSALQSVNGSVTMSFQSLAVFVLLLVWASCWINSRDVSISNQREIDVM